MSNFTTLRLINKWRENGGEWFAATLTDYHRAMLKSHCDAEPNAGWKLETRGVSAPWHDINEHKGQSCNAQ